MKVQFLNKSSLLLIPSSYLPLFLFVVMTVHIMTFRTALRVHNSHTGVSLACAVNCTEKC